MAEFGIILGIIGVAAMGIVIGFIERHQSKK